MTRRTAVVGSGVAGLVAAYALQQDPDRHVTLIEAADRLGGHADTHDVTGASGAHLDVDTGFIVHNDRTYPVLLRVFADLGVETRTTEMSMSIHCEGCGLEYAGARKLPGLFPSTKNLRNVKYLKMLTEVKKFHRAAAALVAEGAHKSEISFGDFLAANGFSQYFTDHFAIPMVACVWSCPPNRALEYPARYLFSFLENHGMLSVSGSPQWRTVVGGSRSYVRKLAATLAEVRLGSPVVGITRTSDGVEIASASGTETFDEVVIATHPDQALALLTDPTPLEKELLGAFAYEPNITTLHSDSSLMPDLPGARASWNYRTSGCGAASDTVLVTYDMNRLQGLQDARTHLVTLNGGDRVDPATVIDTMHYAHPTYTVESVAMQARLPEINTGVTAFAGAWQGWGFHEDGARSGLAAARSLGAPW